MKSMPQVILLTLMAFVTAIAAPVHCSGGHGVTAFHACCDGQSRICPSGSVQKHSHPDSGCCIGIHTFALVNGLRLYSSSLQNASSLLNVSGPFKYLEQQIAMTGNDSTSHFGSGRTSGAIDSVVLRI